MFRRSTSRPHPRIFRSSASSPRNHQRKGHVFAYTCALLLLSTVAFLHAKSGSPQAAQYDPSDSVPFHRRSVTEETRGGAHEWDRWGSEALRKGFKVGLELPKSNFDEHNKQAETFDTKASERRDVRKSGNGSLVLQDDYDDTDDDEQLEEDPEPGLELETDEMEELENPRDIAAEGLDDMDEGDDSEEEGQLIVEVEQLERKGLQQKEGEINEELEKETDTGNQDSDNLPAVVTGSVNTIHERRENSSEHLPERKAENKRHEGEAATEHNSKRGLQRGAHAAIALQRLGGVKGVPSWDPLEGLGIVGLDKSARDARRSFVRGYGMNVSLRNDGIIWDHLLGVARRLRTGNIKYPTSKFGADEISKLESLPSSVKEKQGSSSSSTQGFSSDDEPLDENIRERLEEVMAIEDALLLRTGKYDTNKKERSSKASFDPLNPTNNPLLQDPDTFGPNGLTKSDKAIWKVIRKASVENTAFLPEKSCERGSESTLKKENVSNSESHRSLPGQLVSIANAAERSTLDVLTKPRNFNSLLLGNPNTEKTDLQQQIKLATLVDPRTSIEVKEVFNPHLLSQENGEETLSMSLLNATSMKAFNKEEADNAEPNVKNHEETEEHLIGVVKSSVIKNPESQRPTDTSASNRQVGDVQQLQHMDSESMRAVKVVTHEDRTLLQKVGSSKIEPFREKHQLAGDRRKWGFFPGIYPFLSFSEFLEQFLLDSRCSLRVFMAWTTSPWAYTVRYQRGLESLLHFHSQACVVVFSESIELNFFESFVEDGFRVAVVLPNLEELLKGTPADVFASVWLTWRKVDLFHIHYTELLRLAALYKYGGIYLDTDVIILKPLNLLKSTIGAESMENHMQRLNGAVMAFDRFSPFLLKCLAEFTATYNDKLLEFNGAELLTRVVNRIAGEQNKKWEQLSGIVNIKQPQDFFPLSSGNITRYFVAPVNEQQILERDQMLKVIFNQSLALHFWNQRTSRLVPEVGSVVEEVINHYCIRCNEYL